SRWPAPSTRERTRFSATSSPSECWGFPGRGGTMRFAFTDEQAAFRDAVRGMLDDACTPAVVRAAWHNETGRSDKVWALLDEMGAFDVGEIELSLVLEEAGRAAVPEPVLEHAAVGVAALRDVGEAVPAGAVVSVGMEGAPLVPYAD